jgi:ornithine cyclodeaminase
MPAHLWSTGDLAVKLVCVYPRNVERGLPTIHALVLAIDESTGAPVAVIEGAALTAIRTGAASGAATDLLARPECETAAIFGAGVQGRTQLEAVCTVRTIRSVWVYDQDAGRAEAFRREMAGRGPIPERLQVARSPHEAVADADIVCTATTSSSPVFQDRDIRPGTHINAVGAFTPAMCEVDPATVKRSLIVVDSREAVLAEAGDLIQPIKAGLITADDFHAELGEIAARARPGRTDPRQITLFKSVGVAVQDAAAAARALSGAKARGLGRTLDL